ncbi:MAG: PAS domain S-box protein, partial [Desulfuromonadales bacterium]
MTTTPPESAQELRRSAEKKTRLDDLKILEEQYPENSPQIIHELLVHQIELEMQNEELRLAQQELISAKARYFDLYNLAPIGYLTVTEGGIIQDANLTAATMLGVGRGILLQKVLSKFIHPEDAGNYYLRCKQLIKTRELQAWDIRLMRAGGSIFWAHMKCTASDDRDDFWIIFTDITERKQAEEALHQASTYNRRLIEAALDPLVTIGPDGRITDTNQATMAITGASREELVGSIFSDYFSDPDTATAGYRKVFLEGTVRDYPLEVAHRDGRLIPVHYNATQFRDSDGNVAGVFAAARDISAQIRYEEALRESEEAYRTVADFTCDWEYWITPDGSMRYTSPSCQLHTGYRADEFRKEPELMGKITHPDDRELFDCHLPPDQSGLVEGVRKHENDFRIITRSGEVRWFAHVCQPVYSSKGKYLGQRASNRDITGRKQLEAALCTSEEKYRHLISVLPDIVYSFDLKRGGAYYSPAVESVLGYSSEYLMEHPMCWHDSIHPDDLQKVESAIENFKAGVPFNLEYRFHHADGRWIWLNDRSTDLSKTEVKATRIEGIATEVTIRKQMEEKLQLAKLQAESANRAKSEFLSNMSHEIRTPMNGLLGMTQLLGMTELSEEQQEYVVALKLSGNNLVSLVNDILDLSKIEAGKITIETAEFSLRHALDEVYLMQKSAIFAKKLAFNVTINEEIPRVILGDQLRVKQIIHNLLGNAAKFTKQGGITIAAEVREWHYGSCIIQISVTDTGIGISPEALEKIFNPFVQEDGSTTR